jgi:RNA polymerase sigma-70 factor, ECF subfamily
VFSVAIQLSAPHSCFAAARVSVPSAFASGVLVACHVMALRLGFELGADLPRRRHDFPLSGTLRWSMDTEVEQLNELMGRYGRGDDRAFEPLYKLMAPRLYRFCLRLTPHRTDADDLLQETFLRLHRARATYLAGANALHWAFAITRSASLDRLRYQRRRPEDLGVAGDVAENTDLKAHDGYRPDVELLAQHLSQVVTIELGRMSEKNRVAYILLREEGLSAKEAAVVVGTTVDVVKQRAHRAYEQLRSAVGAAGWKEQSHDGVWNVTGSIPV